MGMFLQLHQYTDSSGTFSRLEAERERPPTDKGTVLPYAYLEQCLDMGFITTYNWVDI